MAAPDKEKAEKFYLSAMDKGFIFHEIKYILNFYADEERYFDLAIWFSISRHASDFNLVLKIKCKGCLPNKPIILIIARI